MHKFVFKMTVVFFVILLAGLSGCGNDSGNSTAESATTVQGVAAADAPIAGTVTVKDSSNPPLVKTTTTDSGGAYSIDVSDLKPPFLISVRSEQTGTAVQGYSFADNPGVANINLLTTAAVAIAAGTGDREKLSEATSTAMQAISDRVDVVKAGLEEKLDPLFAFYGIDEDPFTGDYETEKTEFSALSKNITMTVDSGILQVLNKQTGALIFSAPVTNISSGTFYPQNMTSCAYTYSAWGLCLPDNTQTRTVSGSSPAGCSGIPELTRKCSSDEAAIPPAVLPGYRLRDSFSSTQAPSKWLGHAERVYSGNRVTVTESYAISRVRLRMYNVGSPNQKLQVGIYSHDAGHDRPGSLIGSWSDPVSNANFTKSAPGQYVTFTGLNVQVTPGTYWIVFNIPTGTGDNNYHYSVYACINTTPRGQTYYNSGWGEFMNSQIIFGLYSPEPGL